MRGEVKGCGKGERGGKGACTRVGFAKMNGRRPGREDRKAPPEKKNILRGGKKRGQQKATT